MRCLFKLDTIGKTSDILFNPSLTLVQEQSCAVGGMVIIGKRILRGNFIYRYGVVCTRVGTKVFVFVFSRKFSRKLTFRFREIFVTKIQTFRESFRENFSLKLRDEKALQHI
jgi:hypothetical protein